MLTSSPKATPSNPAKQAAPRMTSSTDAPVTSSDLRGISSNPIVVADTDVEEERSADREVKGQRRRQRKRKRKARADLPSAEEKKLRAMHAAYRVAERRIAPLPTTGTAVVTALPVPINGIGAATPYRRHFNMGPVAAAGPSRYGITTAQRADDRTLPDHSAVFDELLVALLADPPKSRKYLRDGSVEAIWHTVTLSNPVYTWRIMWYLYKADFRSCFAEIMCG